MLCKFCSLLCLDMKQAIENASRLSSEELDAGCELCKGDARKCFGIVETVCRSMGGEKEGCKLSEQSRKVLGASGIKFAIATRIGNALGARENAFPMHTIAFKALLSNSIRQILGKHIKLAENQANADAELVIDLERGTAEAFFCNLHLLARYVKKSRNVSQNIWECGCNGKGCAKCNGTGIRYESVQAIAQRGIKKILNCKSVVLHANGREDVDVRMLGKGRYCILEIARPLEIPRSLEALQKSILEQGEKYGVEIKIIKKVGKRFEGLITESEFEKSYDAMVSCESDIVEQELNKLCKELSGCVIAQRTPFRVEKRRADLVRKKKIISAECEKIGCRSFRLKVLCQAGTYVKELIHGDKGRTVPSVSSILGKQCRCETLDVTGINDSFIEFFL